MTKTDIAIYRGLKEKFDPEVHVGFFITTDTGELLLGDQSLGLTISGWEINDGVLILKLNTGRDIRVTFPEATETVKGLLSAADKAQLNALQANLDSKVDKVTGKSLLADSEIEKLAGLPNSTELTNSIATAKAAGDNAQSDLNAHKLNTSNPHEVTKAQVGLGNVTNDAQVKRSEMGVANGVATLDADGKVPASQLPSYVDDIIDVYATYSKSDTGVLSDVTLYLDAAHTQLVTGEAGKIYQNIADGEPQYQFRWTGTIFSQTGASSLILGEVTGTAYDGAKGKANADNIAKIKGTSLSHIKDAAPVTTAADKVSINYECYEGNQYGAAGTDHTADIPAATTSKAGVMSATDKTKLENLNSKLVVADEEDVTAVDGKIKFKDRDTTNGMGYKILRLPENGILTQDMINLDNTIYEIRYNFDLNDATITIPENCTLKFEGGSFSNGTIQGNNSKIIADGLVFTRVSVQGSWTCNGHLKWFAGVSKYTIADNKVLFEEKVDVTRSIQEALDSSFSTLEIDAGVYYITDTLVLSREKDIILDGEIAHTRLSEQGFFDRVKTSIFSDMDITLLRIDIPDSTSRRYSNISILGGNFDVSLAGTYTKNCIEVSLASTKLWGLTIDSGVFGPFSEKAPEVGTNTGIKFLTDTGTGWATMVRIKGTISWFAEAINVLSKNSPWVTDVVVDSQITNCTTAITSSATISINSSVQPRMWLPADRKNTPVYNLLGGRAIIGGEVWDLYHESEGLYTNNTLLNIEEDVTFVELTGFVDYLYGSRYGYKGITGNKAVLTESVLNVNKANTKVDAFHNIFEAFLERGGSCEVGLYDSAGTSIDDNIVSSTVEDSLFTSNIKRAKVSFREIKPGMKLVITLKFGFEAILNNIVFAINNSASESVDFKYTFKNSNYIAENSFNTIDRRSGVDGICVYSKQNSASLIKEVTITFNNIKEDIVIMNLIGSGVYNKYLNVPSSFLPISGGRVYGDTTLDKLYIGAYSTSSRPNPSNNVPGLICYDTTIKRLLVWDGSSWTDLVEEAALKATSWKIIR